MPDLSAFSWTIAMDPVLPPTCSGENVTTTGIIRCKGVTITVTQEARPV